MRYFVFLILISSNAFAQIKFEEVSAELGVQVASNIENGGGVSFIDFNNDGWDDLTMTTDYFQPLRYFKNNNGNFQEVFLIDEMDISFDTKSVLWADLDNDGDKDLFVSSAFEFGYNRLYRNDDGLLIEVTSDAGLPLTNQNSYGVAIGDYNNDSFLDIFIANRDFVNNGSIPNTLLKNNGDFTFSNVNQVSNIGDINNLALQPVFFDFDNDNDLDIYITSDKLYTKNILYRNNGDETFTDVSVAAGVDYSMDGMSTAVEDYNSDGFLDIYITNIYDIDREVLGNVLMQNNGDGTFTNTALDVGVRYDQFTWGANWLDGNNDGHLDLYVSAVVDVNGGPLDSSAFFLNDGSGFFNEINDSGFENDLAHSYGNAIGDLNNDGFMDIVVANFINTEFNYIWENKSHEVNTNNWLKVNVEGTTSNRDGIGARIEIGVNGQKQYRVVTCGESYLSQNSSSEIFGVGDADSIDYLKVTWPTSGLTDQITNVDSNQTIVMVEGENILKNNTLDEQSILITPNPASNLIHLESPLHVIDAIQITDLQGRSITSMKLNQVNRHSIAINGLAKAVYLLSIETEGQTIVKRFVKE